MRQRTGVDDDCRRTKASRVNGFNEVAFVVRLHVANAESQLRSAAGEVFHVFGQGRGTVDLGAASSQLVKIWTR